MSVSIVPLVLLTALAARPAGEQQGGPREIEAEVVCIGCELRKNDGIDSQCSLYAKHEHGLLVDSGQIWSIVNNETGHELRTDHDFLTRRVRVSARPLPRAQYLDVRSVELIPNR